MHMHIYALTFPPPPLQKKKKKKKETSLHFLAQSSNISRYLDHTLAAVMVLVELAAEGAKHGHEGVAVVAGGWWGGWGCCGGRSTLKGVVALTAMSAAVAVVCFPLIFLVPKAFGLTMMVGRHRMDGMTLVRLCKLFLELYIYIHR